MLAWARARALYFLSAALGGAALWLGLALTGNAQEPPVGTVLMPIFSGGFVLFGVVLGFGMEFRAELDRANSRNARELAELEEIYRDMEGEIRENIRECEKVVKAALDRRDHEGIFYFSTTGWDVHSGRFDQLERRPRIRKRIGHFYNRVDHLLEIIHNSSVQLRNLPYSGNSGTKKRAQKVIRGNAEDVLLMGEDILDDWEEISSLDRYREDPTVLDAFQHWREAELPHPWYPHIR